jgi:sec-independent protein translocase protein TatB
LSGIGLSELVLLFVIGLLILGPDRLPRVASQIGRWVGRARRTANQLRYQLERELALADQEKAKKLERTPGPRPDFKPETPEASSPDSREGPESGGHEAPGSEGHDAPASDGHAPPEPPGPTAAATAAADNDQIRQD